MFRKALYSKLHRATVTEANVDYEGSITIPIDLLAEAKISEFEAVCIWNVTNGNRFETYTIAGVAGSGEICVNGAAAHLVTPGDKIIIASFAFLEAGEMANWKPKAVFLDENNRVKQIRSEQAYTVALVDFD